MKMYIPEIGDKIQLTKDWRFTLYMEYRNRSICDVELPELANIALLPNADDFDENSLSDKYDYVAQAIKRLKKEGHRHWWYLISQLYILYTLPKGTLLQIDRIFIRKGKEEFSSITFKILDDTKRRFWAKLADVNNMEFKRI